MDKPKDCNAYLTYDIGDGGRRSDCAHNEPSFYCLIPAGHDGKHRTTITLQASSDKEPFLYEYEAAVEWE